MSKVKRRVFGRDFKLSADKRMMSGESVAALSRELGVPKGHVACQPSGGRVHDHRRDGVVRRSIRIA